MNRENHRLERVFKARSVAIVGASETGVRARNAIQAMSNSGVSLHLINRRGERVLGRDTYRSLTDLSQQGVTVDAALVFTNGAAAVDVTAEAASLDVGGVIVNAGGFAEAGGDGVALQQRLVRAAGAMPLIGPNCNGIVAPSLGLQLAGSPPGLPMLPGRIAFVTHSGATMMPMGNAGVERGIGFSYLVSTGNEAVVDMAEVVAYLATDASTSAICLLIETVRNPAAFFAAVNAAIAAGKPVLALKNGRSARGQAIAKSHTGAVAGEAWIYASALRQHGVILANDLVDLADRAVLFDQVPRAKWTAAAGLAVASGSGGWVTMASDVCAEEGIDLPALEELHAQIQHVVPGATVVNPLDLTGAAMTDPKVMQGALQAFVDCNAVDTVLIQSSIGEGAEGAIKVFAGPALDVAPSTDKLLIVGSIEGGAIGPAMLQFRQRGIAVTRGLRATVRAIKAMSDFVNFTPFMPATQQVRSAAAALPLPSEVLQHPSAGRMLGFAATMELLTSFGVPVAPYVVIAPSQQPPALPAFASPWVVKLAEVPHRSDIGAVRLGVTPENFAQALDELRALAQRLGESPAVAVQSQYKITSELFIGVNGANELGPLVVCGLGGIFVELMKQVAGRLAPFGSHEAERLVREVNASGVLDGPRGTPAWPQEKLVSLLSGVAALAVHCQPWLESLDINPLALTSDGIVAVDGLAILRSGASNDAPALK